jgi:uncharacterized protein
MKTDITLTSLILIILLAISGCGKAADESAEIWLHTAVFSSGAEQLAYADSINGLRLAKDEWMRVNPNSPLLPEDKEVFAGLNYYDPDPSLVFRVRLVTYNDPEIIIIATTTGDEREAIRYGYFDVGIEGMTARLHAYKFTRHRGTELESYLFIPFRDATSGEETYEAGRYLDVEETFPGYIEVDFNDAYNPYCVYNDRYSCPLPPAENHLDVPVQAGEKKFKV